MPRTTLRRVGVPLAVVASLGTAGAVAPASPSVAATAPRLYSFIDTYQGKPVRWDPCAPIRYKVNLNGVASRAELARVRAAFAQAGRALGGVSMVYAGSTTVVPDEIDQAARSGANVVAAFAAPGSGPRHSAILTGWEAGDGGFATSYWTGGDGEHIPIPHTGAVVIDYRKLKGMSARVRTSLYLHEIGHAVGLGHAADSRQVMHEGLTAGSPATYQSGDLAGLRQLGRKAGCLELPARPKAPTLTVSGGNLVVRVPSVRSVSGAVTYTLNSAGAGNLDGRTSTSPVFTVPVAEVLGPWSSPSDAFSFSVSATNRVGQVTGAEATITATALGLAPTTVDPSWPGGDPANG